MINIMLVSEDPCGAEALKSDLDMYRDFSVYRRTPGQLSDHGVDRALCPEAVIWEATLPDPVTALPDGLSVYRNHTGFLLTEGTCTEAFYRACPRWRVIGKAVPGRMVAEELRKEVFEVRISGDFDGILRPVRDRREIMRLLDRSGIRRHQSGYAYLADALQMIGRHRSGIHSLVRSIYPAVAEKYGISVHSVERAIRYAAYTAWEKNRTAFFEELFPQELFSDQFPTSKEWVIAFTCMLEREEEKKKQTCAVSF